MNLKPWETTIQQIADESSREPKEAGRYRVFTAWRAKLEKEPTSLPPFRIDQIVREVRTRLNAISRSNRPFSGEATRCQSPELILARRNGTAMNHLVSKAQR
jgi:hypothetical protein